VASNVSRRIERIRLDNDWDYRELGKVLGVAHSTAHDWANGTHDPNLKSLKRIARRLRIDLAELIS
jgi:transcriptional regulator with XRE-family HTH domain